MKISKEFTSRMSGRILQRAALIKAIYIWWLILAHSCTHVFAFNYRALSRTIVAARDNDILLMSHTLCVEKESPFYSSMCCTYHRADIPFFDWTTMFEQRWHQTRSAWAWIFTRLYARVILEKIHLNFSHFFFLHPIFKAITILPRWLCLLRIIILCAFHRLK